jgi:hypothetical protein
MNNTSFWAAWYSSFFKTSIKKLFSIRSIHFQKETGKWMFPGRVGSFGQSR